MLLCMQYSFFFFCVLLSLLFIGSEEEEVAEEEEEGAWNAEGLKAREDAAPQDEDEERGRMSGSEEERGGRR